MPARAAVLENGRMGASWALGRFAEDVRMVLRGRRGAEAKESLSKQALKLEILRSFIVAAWLSPQWCSGYS